MLKHISNLSDESIVKQWSENIYFQYFTRETYFAPGVPFESSELAHFRKRIGESGVELFLKENIRVNGKDALDPNVNVNIIMQYGKKITCSFAARLHQENLAVAFNFKRIMNKWKKKFFHFFQTLFFHFQVLFFHFFLSFFKKKIKTDFLKDDFLTFYLLLFLLGNSKI